MEYSVILSYLVRNLNHRAELPVGLFRGKAGIALALYIQNKCHADANLEKMADSLLDEVCSALDDVSDCSLAEGAAGIGFVISYLHAHHMVNGDINDILFDVDAAIYREVYDESISKDYTFVNGYVGYLFYTVARLEYYPKDGNDIQKTLMQHLAMTIMDRIIQASPKLFSKLGNDVHTTILWEPPIILFLMAKCKDLGVYSQKIPKIIKQWMVYFDSSFPHYQINRLAWCSSLIYLNRHIHDVQLDRAIGNLLKITDFESLKYEYDSRYSNVREGWLYYALVICWSVSHLDLKSTYARLLYNVKSEILSANEARLRQLHESENGMHPLGLIDGIGGVLLALIYLEKNK